MANEIAIRQTESTLPAQLRNELQIIKNSPGPYYVGLKPEKTSDPRPNNAPILSQIQKENGFANALAVLTFAIHEVKEWFNVKNNLTPDQEAMTAELILDCDSFYDLTLGNIKACFRQKMMTEKLYDRLDGNIIIGWLRQFKSDMAEQCENVNIGLERQRQREENRSDTGAIAHATYMAMLEAKAGDGDEEAQRTLNEIRKRSQAKSPEQQRKEQTDYMRYKAKYLREKGLLK